MKTFLQAMVLTSLVAGGIVLAASQEAIVSRFGPHREAESPSGFSGLFLTPLRPALFSGSAWRTRLGSDNLAHRGGVAASTHMGTLSQDEEPMNRSTIPPLPLLQRYDEELERLIAAKGFAADVSGFNREEFWDIAFLNAIRDSLKPLINVQMNYAQDCALAQIANQIKLPAEGSQQ